MRQRWLGNVRPSERMLIIGPSSALCGLRSQTSSTHLKLLAVVPDHARERAGTVAYPLAPKRKFVIASADSLPNGFYEFTPHTDPKSKRKHKWLFTKTDEPWFCIAGIWRTTEVGETFTMLTTAPGPDVAPYHDRQVVVLDRADWARWLDPGVPAKTILRPLPSGSLQVEQVA
jgi:hypothetical protein